MKPNTSSPVRSDTNMSFPAFFGFIGTGLEGERRLIAQDGFTWQLAFTLGSPRMTLWIDRAGSRGVCCCDAAPTCPRRPIVFIWGQPLVAGDCDFEPHTKVQRIAPADLPAHIGRLYRRHGPSAFALLEGDFSLILADPESKSVFLAVDKFGCGDIAFRPVGSGLALASDASLLTGDDTRLNPMATAFFLAQEGFVPAPFTLFESIETVGRARFLHVREHDRGISVESRRYWSFSHNAPQLSRRRAVAALPPLLESAIQPRLRQRNAILLSGGSDSALLANSIPGRDRETFLALTGSVRGHAESEQEDRAADELSVSLGIPHHSICIDPLDECLPDEWSACCQSWTGGVRVTLPLFYRFAKRLSSLFGCGFSTFSGQMADTLADNNYTSPSSGYAVRRMFFSAWFLHLMPLLRVLAPGSKSFAGKAFSKAVEACAGHRAGTMAASVLDGLVSAHRFYAGRIFGFGEMPGRSPCGLPVLSKRGFEEICAWYTTNFVSPVVSRLTPQTFYREMLELSLDMCMLHLDTRLVFHAIRLGGGHAEMPFLDSRVVNFFINLPYSARAFYRWPKYVIRKQFTRNSHFQSTTHSNSVRCASGATSGSTQSRSFEELLLAGALGHYFRELLKCPSALDRAPGLRDFIDEQYLEEQRSAFLRGQSAVDHKFISRLAALEFWSKRTAHAVSPATFASAGVR